MPKKPGRPATGRDPGIVVRLPDEMVKNIDAWAAQFPGLTRSAAIRTLIAWGLRATRKKSQIYDPKSYQTFGRVASESPPETDRPRLGKDVAVRGTEEKSESPPLMSPDGVYSARERKLMSKDAIQAAIERAEARSKK
jgi:hypothetical protein